MESLFKVFSNLGTFYYGITADTKLLFGTEFQKECFNFIEEFFKIGKKEATFSIPFKEIYKANGKHYHTVSLFFMGEYLKEIYSNITTNEIENITNFKFGFDYYWFLASLYHDVASCIEHEKYESVKLNYLIFEHEKNSIGHTSIPLRFSKKAINNYYEWRKSKNSNEHGIIAGQLLYSRLLENFYKTTGKTNWNVNKEMTIKGKKYRPEQLELFAYISDAIICHNIWMAYDKKTVDEYKENGLDELIINNSKDRLSLSNYPLQFVLCLLDTIEPTKRFVNDDFTAQNVLENIYLEKSDKKIKIGWNDKIKKQPEFFKWLGNITELPKWMSVDVSACYHQDNLCCIDISIL